MSNRTIKQIIPSQKINMGGIFLQQPLPNSSIQQIDPFILIHHGALPVKKGKGQRESGVGPHPHRGFSPVTFVFKGGVQHQDSLGNNEIVLQGGTQWINAGRGIIHSERPTIEMVEQGGENEIIQLNHKNHVKKRFMKIKSIPGVLCPMSYVSCRLLHFTCHLSPVTNGNSHRSSTC